MFLYVQKLEGIRDINPETNGQERTVSASLAGVDEDSTVGVQNVAGDKMSATKSAEGVKFGIEMSSPDLHTMSSAASPSDNVDSVTEAKVDADLDVIADSSVPAAVVVDNSHAAGDNKDQSSTEVQRDDSSASSADSIQTQHGRSVFVKCVWY